MNKVLCVLGVLCVLCVSAFAQSPLDRSLQIRKAQTPADGEIHAAPVQGNVYMLVGGGANIAVQVGDEGVLVVDTGTTQMSEKVLAAIRKLSSKPIRYIINTTLDPDHTGGNEVIARAGSTTPSRTKTCSPG
jgi:glyoxylase-like metal-dependent hydrolase (beta-lactamase superfamily II)